MGGNADARIYKVYPCHTSRVVAGVNYFHQREAWEDDISVLHMPFSLILIGKLLRVRSSVMSLFMVAG